MTLLLANGFPYEQVMDMSIDRIDAAALSVLRTRRESLAETSRAFMLAAQYPAKELEKWLATLTGKKDTPAGGDDLMAAMGPRKKKAKRGP